MRLSELKTTHDWEVLEDPLIIDNPVIEGKSEVFSPIPSRLVVARDKDYRISIEATGTSSLPIQTFQQGNLRAGETINGEDVKVHVAPCSALVLHKTIGCGSSSKMNGNFSLDVRCGKVSLRQNNANQVDSLVQFAINCPDVSWSAGTSKTFDGKLKIRVGPLGEAKFDKEYEYDCHNRSDQTNCAILKNKFGRVVISELKIDSIREQFKPCSIHFLEGNFLEDNFRNKWIEAISFFLGKRLIKVGTTTLDEKGWLIEQVARDPYSSDLRLECARANFPPAPLADAQDFLIDSLLSDQIEKFIESYDTFDLGNVVWNLWFGRMMPLGLNILGYASSLEALETAWFNSQKSKKHGAYLLNEDFCAEIDPIVANLKQKFPSDENWTKIAKNISNANRLSIKDKHKRFFDELELEFGEIESEAISSRHKFAHGGSLKTEDVPLVVKTGRAYETLVSRCILKAIEGIDRYFDYSTYNFPVRAIEAKMMGAEETGKILP